MKSILVICILIVYTLPLLAQKNYITNYSFEHLTDCPNGDSQIDKAIGWFNLNKGTADIYNLCALNPTVSMPENLGPNTSFQYAKTGNGYAGMYIFSTYGPPFLLESIETKLKERLTKNKKYYISFYCNPAYKINSINTFSDKIGLGFSSVKDNETFPFGNCKYIKPAIEHSSGFIDDTLRWTKISGCYIANGTEEYAIVGNFRSQAETNYRQEITDDYVISYVYIEDVGVYEYNPLPDTILLCNGISKTYSGSFLDAIKYKWNNGDTDSIYTFNKEGKYWVEVTIDGCTFSDTTIVINTDNIARENEIVKCKNMEQLLYAPIAGQYIWSNGSNNSSISVSSAGQYLLTVINDCGKLDFVYNVKDENCNCTAFIPNAFTPNNDGINDELKPIFQCELPIEKYEFLVFDRWGNTVFKIDNNYWGWDGKFKGIECDIGIYFFLLKYTYNRNGNLIQMSKKGDITLIR
jgi:gliding motility-associated-like protein